MGLLHKTFRALRPKKIYRTTKNLTGCLICTIFSPFILLYWAVKLMFIMPITTLAKHVSKSKKAHAEAIAQNQPTPETRSKQKLGIFSTAGSVIQNVFHLSSPKAESSENERYELAEIITTQCPKCGRLIEVDTSLEYCHCIYCGTRLHRK